MTTANHNPQHVKKGEITTPCWVPGMPQSASFLCIRLNNFKPLDFFIGGGVLGASSPHSSLLCEQSFNNGRLGNIGGLLEAESGDSIESCDRRKGVGMKCLGRRGLIGGVEAQEEGGDVSLRSGGVSSLNLHVPGIRRSLQTNNKKYLCQIMSFFIRTTYNYHVNSFLNTIFKA